MSKNQLPKPLKCGAISKLSDDEWLQIKTRWQRNENISILAKEYNISRTIIYKKIKEENWIHPESDTDFKQAMTSLAKVSAKFKVPEERAVLFEKAQNSINLIKKHSKFTHRVMDINLDILEEIAAVDNLRDKAMLLNLVKATVSDVAKIGSLKTALEAQVEQSTNPEDDRIVHFYLPDNGRNPNSEKS